MGKMKIFFETERLSIRSAEERDKEAYMCLREEVSQISKAYRKKPEFRDYVWDKEFNSESDIFMTAFLKESGSLTAIGSFQNYEEDCIELGFDVAGQYRKRGLATELVRGMLREARILFPGKAVKIKTLVTNAACRRVAEKCGGVLAGYEPTPTAVSAAAFLEKYGHETADGTEFLKLKERYADYIEENKTGVCVYVFEAPTV